LAFIAGIAGIAANQQFGIRTAPINSFERAVQQIIEHYIVEPDRDGLERAAINGMVGTLDDYSELLSPEAYQRLLTNAEGTFAGIGIEIGLRQDLFTVLRIIPQSPAAASVVQVGDRIKAVDGNTMQGLLLTEVIDKLRGPAGSRVNLVLSRAQRARHTNGEPVVIDIELTLVRQTLDGAYLDIRLTENNVVYVRATQCYDAMASDIQRAISTVSEAPLKGIVLDLRSNPGGTLTCAVGTVDLFLTSGTVVTIQDKRTPEDQAPSRAFTATSDTPFPELPLAILVNGSTASAAEIIAGALQDHGRATILGSQTFAKGTVQTLLPPLPNGSALKITTARYLTPLGRSFDQEGLVPDKLVENDDNGAIAAAVSALMALQTD
jgi:carboxyl-terminal processing protease